MHRNLGRADSMPPGPQQQQQPKILQRAESMQCPLPQQNQYQQHPNESHQQQQMGTSQPQQQVVGPRRQCDQIIYEAMAKACEIVVRGRCRLDDDKRDQNDNIRGQNDTSNYPGSYRSNYGTTLSQQQQHQRPNSRFNLETPEVPSVRRILSSWRRALHVPLRLDVYFQHSDGMQRELLERYCLDYAPDAEGSASLRAVCKRVVVQLRSLHCLMRMLPAHGWDGGGGGGNMYGRNDANPRRGSVGYSIYTIPHEEEPTLPSPSFARRELPSVPTGYGTLYLSVVYDATISHSTAFGDALEAQTRSIPIPIDSGEERSNPPSNAYARSQFPAVSDYIISDYHSPPLLPAPVPINNTLNNDQGEKQRVMSGLSLAMMGEEEDQVMIPPPHHANLLESPEEEALAWGSPATRAAFHLPPGYTETRAYSSGESGSNFPQHSGYGYGYNGAQVALREQPPPPLQLGISPGGLSISPSPLMSTPPQAMWGKPKVRGEAPSAIQSVGESAYKEDGGIPLPFSNPTSLQPLPASSASRSASAFHSASASQVAPSSLGSSPHHNGSLERSSNHNRKRTSSSSVLLPPVTSLDLLQKSPFSATKKLNAEATGGAERSDSDGLAMPFILESYRDEMLTSSIPRMISADPRARTGSIGGLTHGGSSSNPLLSTFGSLAAISGGYYSTGPMGHSARSHHSHNVDAEEMPFAIDNDFPSIGAASNPFAAKSSRSLWGSGKGEAFDVASTMNGLSEVTSSLAISALHQRCATEGKSRLKLFESTQSIKLTPRNPDVGECQLNDDYATIKDQLSDFRSFGASLMVGSIHDSCSE